ncbi:calcium-binding protein [Nostoc sp. CHAB 5715]|uniref:calcium-binding protein n=1 Tax=Nostoc sp. CHAB 5715 TaxID=2780400 RepID=UPI001E4C45F1|nr:calcium-binding protein [Nostoc sp. CHAB 5715]MCC5624969.1 pre-peptidase C-terminal domain-containing protein [Nostoc sp. CHAB 5715]
MEIVNDNFANSISLVGSSVSTTGTNVGATGEPGEPNHAGVKFGNDVNSVWYNWTAPASGQVVIDTFGSNYDTSLAAYQGSSVNNLTTIAGNDDTSGLQSQVVFTAVAGQTYQIAVDGFRSRQGSINLNLNLAPNYTQIGTVGNDFLFGTGANDVIRGQAGNDVIYGNGGTDYLQGDAGNDSLYGASGADYIDGGADNDVLYGNGGKDILIGGAGNDLIYGGSDADYILGGAGNDTIYANGGGDFINSGSGLDTIWLGSGAARVVLEAGDGFDTIKNLQLGQTLFQLGSNLSYANLTFADSANGAVISAGNDVLAVVSSQTASAINNAANFV